MKKIKLSKNKIAIIDDNDYKLISKYSWHCFATPWSNYAVSSVNGRTVYMHRLLMNCPSEKQIDHINHNGLNNTRENLRIVNQSQNNANFRLAKNNTTGYKGTHLYKRTMRWAAHIQFMGKKIHLGYFKTKEEAAIAYNKKAIELFGNFANLNIIN